MVRMPDLTAGPLAKSIEDQQAIFDAAQSSMEKRIAAAAIKVMQTLRDNTLDADLLAAVRAHDWHGVLRAINLGYGATDVDALNRFLPIFEEARVGFVQAGQAFAATIPARQADGSLGAPGTAAGTQRITFDPMHDTSISYMRDRQKVFLSDLLEKHREAARLSLVDGLNRQEDPVVIASRLKDQIGLTPRQGAAVRNFERMLREGDAAVLSRKLRDRRFDRTLERVIAGEATLSEEKIRTMVNRYYDRFRRHRALTIAQTESTLTASMAQTTAWQQAVDYEHFAEQDIVRYWQPLDDGRVRPVHVRIPFQNAEGRGLNEDFVTDLGPMRFPGDPRGLAENVVWCRCRIFTTLRSANEPAPLPKPPPPKPKKTLKPENFRLARQDLSGSIQDYNRLGEAMSVGEMSPDELEALWYYVGSGYRPLNKFFAKMLRTSVAQATDDFSPSMVQDAQRHVPGLDTLVSRSELPEDMLVYRGTGNLEGTIPMFNDLGHEGMVGMELADNGFFSVSVRRRTAERFASANTEFSGEQSAGIFETYMPKGSKALWANNDGEGELIVNRGSRWRIFEAEKIDAPDTDDPRNWYLFRIAPADAFDDFGG